MTDRETDIAWSTWLAVTAAGFLYLEYRYPTFCSFLRRHGRIHPQRKGHRIAGMALVGSVSWFLAHILDPHN